eukprot:gb/GECG01005564.1/.p1 GENE.gb/GECG01005564.1/~~gb/GECG01005564.1/.p1  ORF type:complete len:332 (+),score=66.18 gb/GECG01005564.1/:1-996(+)
MGSGASKQVAQSVSRVLRRGGGGAASSSQETLANKSASPPSSTGQTGPATATAGSADSQEQGTHVSPIHQKDETLVERAHEPRVEEHEADVGQEQFRLFQQMQRNPALLDSDWGLIHSSQQRAIEASRLSLPESFRDPSQQHRDQEALSEQQENALEQQPFGPRPPEAGPGDQLILRKASNEELLTLREIVEIFTKREGNPEFYSYSRLAEEYEIREDELFALLKFTCPPTYVRYKDEYYGVYEIRDFDASENLISKKYPTKTFDPTVQSTLRREKYERTSHHDGTAEVSEEIPRDDPNKPRHRGPESFLKKDSLNENANALRQSDTDNNR